MDELEKEQILVTYTRNTRILFVVAGCFWVLSFFLPAGQVTSQGAVFKGYEAAYYSLQLLPEAPWYGILAVIPNLVVVLALLTYKLNVNSWLASGLAITGSVSLLIWLLFYTSTWVLAGFYVWCISSLAVIVSRWFLLSWDSDARE